VVEREAAESYEASEPQIWAPKGVITHWQLLRKQQAERALNITLTRKEAKSSASH